jgi:hypothetical protein
MRSGFRPRFSHVDPATLPDVRSRRNPSDDPRLAAAQAHRIDFPAKPGQTARRSFKAASNRRWDPGLSAIRAPHSFSGRRPRMEGRLMVRFIRLLAAATLAAGLAAPPLAARAQTGPLESGPLDRATQAAPKKAKPRRTAMQKRAKNPAPAGRDITVHARPSYLTAGTQVPVGTVGNGYVYGTFNQPTPIEGTFMGMRGRERLIDPLSNAAPVWTLFRF